MLLALHLDLTYIYSRRVSCICNQHSLSAQLFLASIRKNNLGGVPANRFGGGEEAGTKEVPSGWMGRQPLAVTKAHVLNEKA